MIDCQYQITEQGPKQHEASKYSSNETTRAREMEINNTEDLFNNTKDILKNSERKVDQHERYQTILNRAGGAGLENDGGMDPGTESIEKNPRDPHNTKTWPQSTETIHKILGVITIFGFPDRNGCYISQIKYTGWGPKLDPSARRAQKVNKGESIIKSYAEEASRIIRNKSQRTINKTWSRQEVIGIVINNYRTSRRNHLTMPITEDEKAQIKHQQALHILKEHLEGDQFDGAKIFCCEPEGWIAAIGRPLMSICPNGNHVIQVVNKRQTSIRQWDDLNHLARWDEEFHKVRQLVLTAATFEEVNPNRLYSAYNLEQTRLDAITFLNEIRQGNYLIRFDGTDNNQSIGVMIWYSRARLSTKFSIDPIETNIQSQSITIRHEEHRNLTSIDPENPIPLQYVLAKEGLKIITCYCDTDNHYEPGNPPNEAEEAQYDNNPEPAGVENMEAGENQEGDNPGVLSNVIEGVDTLRGQVDAVARGLNIVRHDLGILQNPAPCTCGQ